MTTMSELDQTMEDASSLADALIEHVNSCPTSRTGLIAWVLNYFDDAESLSDAAKALPEVTPQLSTTYRHWIASGCERGAAEPTEDV